MALASLVLQAHPKQLNPGSAREITKPPRCSGREPQKTGYRILKSKTTLYLIFGLAPLLS